MNEPHLKSRITGRGAQISPANRYERVRLEDDFEQLAADDQLLAQERKLPTVFLPNTARRIICENDSPDVGFRYSINPYRGCEHGCSYCYARPGHETLGLSAGLDFETKIIVKHDAPELLRQELAEPRWQGETIALSGVTDCYQPAERQFRLTRGCLEVMLEARQPLGIVSKNVLMLRDLDVLAPLAKQKLVHVYISVTTLDADLARRMEPRTATPSARLGAVRQLTDAGVPVGVMIAPIIPGLNDLEVPAIMAAARDAGALRASYVLLRLPLAVRPIFEEWLAREVPLKAEKITALVRCTRDGGMNQAQFGQRMRGSGAYALQISQSFQVFAKKYRLDGRLPELDHTQFRPPQQTKGQMRLF